MLILRFCIKSISLSGYIFLQFDELTKVHISATELLKDKDLGMGISNNLGVNTLKTTFKKISNVSTKMKYRGDCKDYFNFFVYYSPMN